ncbi:MAG: helix-turn-helix transcriptional regulator [Saprospiraceae bacterium]|nr:helix-turn-helix transcriptional regulator [Saprospiraceae bacterium]
MITLSQAITQTVFLNRFNLLIATKLTDPSLTVSRIGKLTGMSRTDMHRKITAFAGMSVSGYLRYMRVQMAKQILLQNPKAAICHIGYEVGFTSPGYFTRVFKSVEGVCPKTYRIKHTTAT